MVRQIGSSYGASPDVLGRCLQRMAGWVSLAVRTVENEFLSFDIMASFNVFNVSELSKSLPMRARVQLLETCICTECPSVLLRSQ